jgi:predicted PurR-regulated permease PerM
MFLLLDTLAGRQPSVKDSSNVGIAMARSGTSRELSQLLALVLAVVAIMVLYLAKTVVVPLALAVLFTFLLAPVVTMLERIRLPRMLAILLVVFASGAAVGSIGWTVFTQLVAVANDIPSYTANINDKVATLHSSNVTSFTRAQKEVERLSKQIGALRADATNDRRHSGTKALGSSPKRPVAVQEVEEKTSRLDTLHGVFGVMISVLLVVVFTFFMLLQREDLRNRFIQLTGHGRLNLMTRAMDEAGHRVSRYLSLQLLVNTCFGSIIFTALHFIGLPHALLWGALAGILRFIPYIGAPLATLLPTALSLAVFNGWTQTLLIMAIFFCMEVVTANFIEPHLYGKHTGLSPLAILVAAVFWSLIWGPIGLILSVPLTVCLVVVGAHVPSLEFLTVLLGDQPVMRPEAHYYQRLLSNDADEATEVLENYLKEKSLGDLYDCVLIPALKLSEQDRHSSALDEATVQFITLTTKELVEELGLKREEHSPSDAAVEASSDGSTPVATGVLHTDPAIAAMKIACVPVRDDADEVIAIMLAQRLEKAGHSAKVVPLGIVDRMLTEVSRTAPDVVCLSALPPYALSHARGVYKRLRAQETELKIIIGLWDYTGDAVKAANEISGGEQNQVCTTLTQAVLQATLSAATVSTLEADSPYSDPVQV